MKRPPTAGGASIYRPEVAEALREYFQQTLNAAIRAVEAGSREPLIYPTTAHFCRSRGLSPNTLSTWRMADRPGIRDAMNFAAQVRCQLANLSEAHRLKLVFPKEADHA